MSNLAIYNNPSQPRDIRLPTSSPMKTAARLLSLPLQVSVKRTSPLRSNQSKALSLCVQRLQQKAKPIAVLLAVASRKLLWTTTAILTWRVALLTFTTVSWPLLFHGKQSGNPSLLISLRYPKRTARGRAQALPFLSPPFENYITYAKRHYSLRSRQRLGPCVLRYARCCHAKRDTRRDQAWIIWRVITGFR